ncbi:MAG: hypothetical protein H7270_02545 [Dermatophilaceae bacterium]|nr:hypothetical protein [Dermatophilaceae bacterium]
MTEQPPVPPPHQPSGLPAGDSPVTQPMPATGPPVGPPAGSPVGSPAGPTAGSPAGPHGGPPVAVPPSPPSTNLWRQATSTHGGRWAIAVAAVSLAALLLLGVVVAGVVVLGGHDRVAMMGQRQDGNSRDQGRQRDGQSPGARDRNGQQQPGMPGTPGMRGGRHQGQGGLEALLGGALHGSMSAEVDGSVQALVFQRGAVTAVSATLITLRSSDGFVGTYGLTAATAARMGAPVKGGDAFVLARAADEVALMTMALPTDANVTPVN